MNTQETNIELLKKVKTIKNGAESLINTMKFALDETTNRFLETTNDHIEIIDSYKEVNDDYNEDKEYLIRNTYHELLNKHINMVEKAEKSFDYRKKQNDVLKISKELTTMEETFNKCLILIEKDIVEVAVKNKTEKYALEKSKELWVITKELEKKAVNYTTIIEPLIMFRISWNEKFNTQTVIEEIVDKIEKDIAKWNNGLLVGYGILVVVLIGTMGLGSGLITGIFFGIFLPFLFK